MKPSNWLFYYKVAKGSPASWYTTKELKHPSLSSVYRQLTNIAHLKSYSEYGFIRIEEGQNIMDILKTL